jgi:xanthine dehydrogenase accessory factor
VSELQDVLRSIEERVARGDRMALATIVGVKGSTYRREGARLLVPEHGSPIGTLSGGCLEGDVQLAAKEVMQSGRARLLRFDLTADDEAVWGWGLGCNGAIDVFVEPAEGAAATASAVRKAVDEQRPVVSVTVVQAGDGGPTFPGTRMLVSEDGSADGSLGDVSLDALAQEHALDALRDGRSRTEDLTGETRAFFEVLIPPFRVLVCGAGHDAVPMVRFGAGLGWRMEVLDDREAFLTPERFPGAGRLVKTEPIDAAGQAGVDDRTFVVVMSHNFLRDKDYLRSFLGTPAAYVGMLGPQARLGKLLDALRQEGFEPNPADLKVVHGPAGLDLGGDGPEEVAWAIIAEILAIQKGRRGGFLKDRRGPIHDRPAPDRPVRAG